MSVAVGVSELPGRTHGVMQHMTREQAGYNLIAGIAELKREHGEIATVNEADRSRPDQIFMRGEYLAGRGPLAAYCTWGPPPEFTSTHDSVNHGDAADLGGPGGAVLSVRAHNLLDGNHRDGVIGRKYGIFNTGAFFYTPEWWHFNIYPSRASVLAPPPGSAAKPEPNPNKETYLMIFTDEIPDPKKPKSRRVTVWDGARSAMLSTLNGYTVDDQIKLIRKQQKATIDSAVRLTVGERQTLQTIYRKMK